jgi:hypothetical protein
MSSPRSAPFGGGAANSCPTTEKRSRAQRSCTRGSRLSLTPELLCCQGARTVKHAPTIDDGRLLRVGKVLHKACLAVPPVIGPSQRSRAMSFAAASPAKRSNIEAGRHA